MVCLKGQLLVSWMENLQCYAGIDGVVDAYEAAAFSLDWEIVKFLDLYVFVCVYGHLEH